MDEKDITSYIDDEEYQMRLYEINIALEGLKIISPTTNRELVLYQDRAKTLKEEREKIWAKLSNHY